MYLYTKKFRTIQTIDISNMQIFPVAHGKLTFQYVGQLARSVVLTWSNLIPKCWKIVKYKKRTQYIIVDMSNTKTTKYLDPHSIHPIISLSSSHRWSNFRDALRDVSQQAKVFVTVAVAVDLQPLIVLILYTQKLEYYVERKAQ